MEYHSCVNCQFLGDVLDGYVCNAFHPITSSPEQLKSTNECPDFEAVKPYNRFIQCHTPTQEELNLLTDEQVNQFNEKYFILERIETETDCEIFVKRLFLYMDEPRILLRTNGNCPIKISNYYNHFEFLSLKTLNNQDTYYWDNLHIFQLEMCIEQRYGETENDFVLFNQSIQSIAELRRDRAIRTETYSSFFPACS